MMIRGIGGEEPPTRIGREAGAAKRRRQGNLRFPWKRQLERPLPDLERGV